MKKLKDKIRKLSLTQQLVSIVVFTLVFFLIFFFGALSWKIDVFVNKQMYGLIHRAQQNVIYNYQRNLSAVDLYGASDPNIIHVIRTQDDRYLSNGMHMIDVDLRLQIQEHMKHVAPGKSKDYKFKDNSLYSITTMDNEQATIATLITKTYHDEFKSTLISSVINMILIVTGVLFLILLIWVSSIIHPLNQIREYINKIRNNEEASLEINRGDEIGELAIVLVEMNDELHRQEKLKEEMIQNISHDLKTPIATIKSYGESIKDGVYPYETLEKSVDVIIEHAERLEKKVFNLLMLNRMDYLTHESMDEDQQVDIKEVLEKVIISSQSINSKIKIKIEGTEGVFYGREEPWRVVLENLLDNALRYANSKIIITIDHHFLSVYNDGSQIDENQIDALFTAYEVGEQGQFGLGLSIVNKVASNYGYRASAQNMKDGVKFIVKGENYE